MLELIKQLNDILAKYDGVYIVCKPILDQLLIRTKKIEQKREIFYQSLVPYVQEYGKTMVREFYDYWSELDKSGTKMRWETEKTWETKLRLARWHRNHYNDKREEKPERNFDFS